MLTASQGENAPVNRGDKALSTGFSEIGEADGNNQKRFQPFPQRNDERLQHEDSLRRPGT